MKNISFRISTEDHATIQAAADHAFLPIAAFLRKLALEYARDNLPKASKPQTTQPVVTPKPNTPVTRDDLLTASDAGTPTKQLAESAGISVQELQMRLSQARKGRTDGTTERARILQTFLDTTPCPHPDPENYRIVNTVPIGMGQPVFVWEPKPNPLSLTSHE